jgi:hypothetical protein
MVDNGGHHNQHNDLFKGHNSIKYGKNCASNSQPLLDLEFLEVQR